MNFKNPLHDLSKTSIGWLVSAIRQYRGLSQADLSIRSRAFSKEKGNEGFYISQGQLSKVENGVHVFDLSTWYSFCTLTDVSTEVCSFGFVDFFSPITNAVNDRIGGIKTPRIYTKGASYSVRNIYPLLKSIIERVGSDQFVSFINSIRLSPKIFYVLDNSLNLNFIEDLLDFYKDQTRDDKNFATLLSNLDESMTSYPKIFLETTHEKDLSSGVLKYFQSYYDFSSWYEKKMNPTWNTKYSLKNGQVSHFLYHYELKKMDSLHLSA